MIPHFEKMLYDNGPLLALYADAWQATHDPLYARVCELTADWVMREMQSPAGGYYASLDADSEGHEGKFYVWDRHEVAGLLDEETYEVFARRYGLDRPANFEGLWHPHVYRDVEGIAAELGRDVEALEALLETARQTLLQARGSRVRPGRDEKILTSWNALMIRGMAHAGQALGRPDWIASAERALDFVRASLWRDGRLLASFKDGRANFAAYLDDYAFTADACLQLLQARWRNEDLGLALALAEALLQHFQDGPAGGFYFTADDHERLIHRPKPYADESLPAGNGIAATVLGRLGHLLGEPRYLEAAERTLRNAWPQITRVPYAHGSLLTALEEWLEPPETVVIRGDADLPGWLQRATERYAPRRISLGIPATAIGVPGILGERPAREGGPVAYVCRGTRCETPTADVEDFTVRLAATEAPLE